MVGLFVGRDETAVILDYKHWLISGCPLSYEGCCLSLVIS